jgi:ABC-type antimicrobial peptide transport system permease subunit
VRLTQSVFVGVNVLNPLVYLAVALAQSAIVVVACIGPALRASRVDPLVALRTD